MIRFCDGSADVSKEASRRPVPTRHEPHVLRAWAAVGLPAVPHSHRGRGQEQRASALAGVRWSLAAAPTD